MQGSWGVREKRQAVIHLLHTERYGEEMIKQKNDVAISKLTATSSWNGKSLYVLQLFIRPLGQRSDEYSVEETSSLV